MISQHFTIELVEIMLRIWIYWIAYVIKYSKIEYDYPFVYDLAIVFYVYFCVSVMSRMICLELKKIRENEIDKIKDKWKCVEILMQLSFWG